MLSKFLSFFLLLFLSHSTAIGQENTSTYTTDTIQVNKYIKDCWDIINTNPDKALLLSDTILSLSRKSDYRQGIFTAFHIKGNVYLNNYDLDLAYAGYKKALLYATKKDKPRNRAVVLSNIGLIYRYRYMEDSAIYYLQKTIEYTEKNNIADINAKTTFDIASLYLNTQKYFIGSTYLFKAKEKSEILNDSTLLMFIYNTFGILYTQIDKFDLALNNFKKGVEISDKGQMINLSAEAYLNIGELYFNLKKDFDSATYYYHLSIDNAIPQRKELYILLNNVNIGNVFFATKKYDSAKVYYQNALNNVLIEKNPSSKAAVLVNLGTFYLEVGEEDLASKYLNSGYKLCKKLDLLLFKKNALEGLYRLDSLNGNYLKALEHFQEFHRVSDSLQSDLALNKLASLEFEKHLASQKFNNDLLLQQNELKNKQISTQRRLIWLSLFVSALLLVFIYVQYMNRKRVKKLHSQLKEKHAHILFVNEELNISNSTLDKQRKQLEELNITKDKFFSILGHDLKSPFVSLLGMLDILNDEWNEMGDDEKHKIIDRLLITSQNNYQLLEDLLNWGKAQQGHMVSKNEDFLVYPKIKHLTNLFQDQILNKKINISIEIPEQTRLRSDTRLFTQILQNFVNNAIKFTESGGDISIKLQTTKNEIQFCVEDSGIGIPEDKISTIFDLNSDFNRPGTNREKSTGMGLILSKEFASVIGGRLTVTSHEGKGSVFCLAFKK